MTTAGVLTSWDNRQAIYSYANDASFNRVYQKVQYKPIDNPPPSGPVTLPYAKPGTVANYAYTLAPMQLKFYHYSTESVGNIRLMMLPKWGTTQTNILGITNGVNFVYATRFGLWIKYQGGNLVRLNDQGTAVEQTVTPANLGGGTDDIAAWPTYFGLTAGDFCYQSGKGQFCIYRPISNPGLNPDRLTLANGYPSTTGYMSTQPIYSPKYNRIYFVGLITGGSPRIMSVVPGAPGTSSIFVHSVSVSR